MGRDKATLPLNGQTLCEHIGDVLSKMSEKVFLVGHPERYADLKYPCIADLHPDLGPLSGLETALSLEHAEFHLLASCDVPNLQSEWFRPMLAEAARGANCVVAQDASGSIQPLCGVYRSACRPVVAQVITQGRLRMFDLLKELDARFVTVDSVILNLNTPGEYDKIANASRRK